jgi:uncharacterized protein (DUF433 family)
VPLTDHLPHFLFHHHPHHQSGLSAHPIAADDFKNNTKLFKMMFMTTTQGIDWSGCPLVQRDPLKLGGAPNIDGMRITPETIVDNYESGFSITEIVDMFPAVNEQQARTILAYAAKRGYLTRPLAA